LTGSFKAWNEISLQQNPYNDHFPAMLTAKAGVGMKSRQFANMLKESHTSHKTKLEIRREKKIQQGNDPSKFNGKLHGGGFFSSVFKRYSAKCIARK